MPRFRARERQERPELFGAEFIGTITAAFRDCRLGRRILIVALMMFTVFGIVVGAQACVLIGLFGIPLLLITRPLPDDDGLPSEAELAVIDADREREEAEEYLASGKGHEELMRILAFLQERMDRHIEVTFGEGDPDWRPVVRLAGVLHRRQDAINDYGGDDVLRFTVGDSGSGFYLDRGAFMRGEALIERGETGELFLLLANDVVLMIRESAPATA